MTEKDTTEEIGIPKEARVKRRKYNMSEAALQQRRDAAQQPKPGMVGKRNNYKHGRYAQSFISRIKPCLSTCTRYPCSLVEEGRTEPGGDCLDAEELLYIIKSVKQALKEPEKAENFHEIAAVNISNSIRVLEMLQEDLLRDGTVVKEKKFSKGELVHEIYKPHPSLGSLSKLIQDLNMTPEHFLLTPKSSKQQQTEEEGVKSLGELMSNVARRIGDRNGGNK